MEGENDDPFASHLDVDNAGRSRLECWDDAAVDFVDLDGSLALSTTRFIAEPLFNWLKNCDSCESGEYIVFWMFGYLDVFWIYVNKTKPRPFFGPRERVWILKGTCWRSQNLKRVTDWVQLSENRVHILFSRKMSFVNEILNGWKSTCSSAFHLQDADRKLCALASQILRTSGFMVAIAKKGTTSSKPLLMEEWLPYRWGRTTMINK